MNRKITRILLASALAATGFALTTAAPAAAAPQPGVPQPGIDTMNTPRTGWTPPDEWKPVTGAVSSVKPGTYFRPPEDCGIPSCVISEARYQLSLSPRNREG